jgi:WD40 repeat protein
MAFSTDNRHLAAADFDGHIRLWDVISGHTQHTDIRCNWPLAAIKFSSDLNLLIFVTKKGTIQYWERLKNVFQEIASLHRHAPRAIQKILTGLWLEWATFSPCMQLLTYKTMDNPSVQIWNFVTDMKVFIGRDRKRRGKRHNTGLVRFSPDSRLLSSVYDELLTIWDVRTGELMLSLKHNHPVDAIALSPCGRIIASSARESIELWDLRSGASKAILIEDGTVGALAFSPDGSLLASHEHPWDATKAQDYLVSNGASQCITKIALSPDGQLVGSASRDNTIRIWDVSTLLPRWRSVCDAQDILELCFSSDSKLLASLSEDRQLYIWDVISPAPSEAPQGSASISDVAYSPDGQTAATTDWPEFGGEVALRETVNGTYLRTLDSTGNLVKGDEIERRWSMKPRKPFGGGSEIVATPDPAVFFQPHDFMNDDRPFSRITFSPDGHSVAAIRSPGSLYIWETSTGRQQQWFSNNSRVKKIIFSPDSQLIALLVDFRVLLWRVNTSKPLHTLSVEAKTAEFSSDGSSLVLAGTELTIWDVATGFRQHTLGDLERDPTALCVSSDGKMIAVSSRDQLLRLWSVTSNAARHFVSSLKETVTTMAFASDGKALATASEHGLIRLWDTSSGAQSGWIIRQEGIIRDIRLLPNELIVLVSDPPTFLKLWNDIKLRIYRYRTPSISVEQVLGRITCNIGLRCNGNWIVQGLENLLWVPPQYRPTDGSVKAWVSQDPATIFIGSVSGHVIKFQCL